MPPSLTLTLHNNRYRYLWLKYVTGFYVNLHCARSLKGSYSSIIERDVKHGGKTYTGILDEFESPYFYLCGVTPIYSENLHMSFRSALGQTISFEDKNVSLVIQDAEQLPISRPEGLDKPEIFLSCRNFQFGFQYLHGHNNH